MKQPKLIQEDINNPAVREIKAAMKANKDLRMHERYQTILMHLHGVPHDEISKLTGRSLSSVYNYVKAYRESGMEGLKMEHSTGRPRKLTEEQEQQVYKTVVEKTPSDVGFPAKMNWTSPIVRKWIEQEYDIRYSDRGARELLYRLKLSFTTPTYTLAKADPVKQEAFKKAFEEIKKNS
jgi:putative transposase